MQEIINFIKSKSIVLNPERKNLLVTLSDSNFIAQAKQLFSSAYWNAGWKGDYMLLAHNIPEEDLTWFSDRGILIRKCEFLIQSSWGVKDECAPVIADKYYLFTEEFKKWKHIIYLDADIIVKAPFEKLTDVNFFGGIQDIYFNRLSRQFYNKKNTTFNHKKYNFRQGAFNGGVLSFNTDIITPSLFKEINKLLTDHVNEFVYGEQTALNLFFYRKWKKLPVIYNVFINYHGPRSQKRLKGAIFHFARVCDYPQPPIWNPGSPFYNEWKTNLDKGESIDLENIPMIKEWSNLKIRYYSLIVKTDFIAYNYIRPFIVFKLIPYSRSAFLYTIHTPGRIAGTIGSFIKKHHPGLYAKLKKSAKK